MRLALLAAIAALAVACSPAEEAELTSEGCNARAVSQWDVSVETFSVEATATGPDCARAVVTLTVRNASGAPLYAESHVTANLMTLKDAQDLTAMNTALAEWVSPNTTLSTTGGLPEWAVNANAPGGEFPFYPDNHPNGFSREAYAALRTANYPMFCYVQGMESLACLAYSDGGIEHIGVQTFPG